MPEFQKHFTLLEARALLPRLRSLFAHIHAARRRAQELDGDLGRALLEQGGDFGGPKVQALARAAAQLQEAVAELAATGVQVKDWERGLVDFPAWRGGREVFFCWELSEEDIGHWHELEAGYAGRKEL